jgi:hypothetical protein
MTLLSNRPAGVTHQLGSCGWLESSRIIRGAWISMQLQIRTLHSIHVSDMPHSILYPPPPRPPWPPRVLCHLMAFLTLTCAQCCLASLLCCASEGLSSCIAERIQTQEQVPSPEVLVNPYPRTPAARWRGAPPLEEGVSKAPLPDGSRGFPANGLNCQKRKFQLKTW